MSSPKNVHSATDPQKCVEIGKKYNWKLKEVKPTNDKVLKVDCIFEGEQTSFEDERYE